MSAGHDRARPYLIQIASHDRAGAEQLVAELEEHGVEIDADYGLVPLDVDQHLHLARGLVPAQAQSVIEEDERVVVFPDIRIGPT